MPLYEVKLVEARAVVLVVKVRAVSEKHARKKIHARQWRDEEYLSEHYSKETHPFDSGRNIQSIEEVG